MAEDIDKVIHWVRSQGWSVTTDADGYRRFYTPDGDYVVLYPATPSNPRRRLPDVITALRGEGVTWPPAVEEGATRPAQEGGPVMREWTVQVAVETAHPLDEEALVALGMAADDRDASVARRREGPGYHVTVYVNAASLLDAAERGVAIACVELGRDRPGTVVGLRVTTPEQFEAETLRPDFPPLASAADAAGILGVSRQRVHQLAASNTHFPAPVARVATGPLWAVPAIEHFERTWRRRPGRRNTNDLASRAIRNVQTVAEGVVGPPDINPSGSGDELSRRRRA